MKRCAWLVALMAQAALAAAPVITDINPRGAEIGRSSTLYARVEGSPERIERVEVGGSAVVVAHGEYRVA